MSMKMRVRALKWLALAAALACFVAVSSATDYYVSYENGSDAGPGTLALPWKTIAKVNAMMDHFNPGDAIFFKRGEAWETTATGLNISAAKMVDYEGPDYLTFGAYGTGAKPILWSADAARANDAILCHTDGISNIHIDGLHVYTTKTDLSNPTPILVYRPTATKWKRNWWISNITIDDSDKCGIVLTQIDGYLIENCEISNTTLKCILIGGTDTLSIKNGTIRNCLLYNPAGEACLAHHALLFPPSEFPHPGPNHLVEDCEIYGAPATQGGIDCQAEYVTYRRCYIHDNANQSVSTGGGTHHITFDSCYFKEAGAGIACQGHAAYGTTDNITVKNCIFDLSGTSFALGICGSNYEIYNNTFYLSHPTGVPRIADFNATYSSFAIKFKNNIIYERTDAASPYVARFLNSVQSPADIGLDWDYNWYYYPNGTPRFYVVKTATGYYYTGASSWKTTWSADAHSSVDAMTDPGLENASGHWSLETDFRLKSGSPCRNTGVWVGIAADYFGNAVNNPPDIGVCAYVPAPTLLLSASAAPIAGRAPLVVHFAGSAMGGSAPYSYQWRFGDGQLSCSQNPAHRYKTAGTFTAALTVLDGQGHRERTFLRIRIQPRAKAGARALPSSRAKKNRFEQE